MANSRHIPDSVKEIVRKRDGGRCRICGRVSEYMEFDHITPYRYGAPAIAENIQLLCRACNLKKRDHADSCPTCLDQNPTNPKAAWLPHDAVVCHRCNTRIATRHVAAAKPFSERSSWLVRRLREMSVARKLVFVGAVGLLIFSLSTLAVTAVSSMWNSLTNRFTASKQSTTGGESCSLVDASGRANLKIKCDTGDCDNDPLTVAGKIQAGASVRKTGKTITSSLPAVGEWTEVIFNNQSYYVASTKLSCQ